MTKSELNLQLDRVMSKYTDHIDRKFDHIDNRINVLQQDMDKRFAQIDIRYNWIIGLVITATIALTGILIKLH